MRPSGGRLISLAFAEHRLAAPTLEYLSLGCQTTSGRGPVATLKRVPP